MGYLSLLRGMERDVVGLTSKEFRDPTRHIGSQTAVALTWILSFEHIRRSERAAADLLLFISCIEPIAIPQSIPPHSEMEETIH